MKARLDPLPIILGLLTALVTIKLTQEYQTASALQIATGAAAFPFQYRILAPMALLSFARWSPLGWRAAEFWFYACAYVAAFRFAYSLWCDHFGESTARVALLVMFVGLVAAAAQNIAVKSHPGVRFPYDAVGLVFVVGISCAILERRFGVLLALLAVGTVNRETTAYLIPALFLVRLRDGRGRMILETVAAGAVLVAVKGGLAWLMPGGSPMEANHWFSGLRSFGEIVSTAMAFGGLWIVLLVPKNWKAVSKDWKRLTIGAGIAAVACLIPCGNLNETRVWNELLPLVSPVIAGAFLRRSARPQPVGLVIGHRLIRDKPVPTSLDGPGKSPLGALGGNGAPVDTKFGGGFRGRVAVDFHYSLSGS